MFGSFFDAAMVIEALEAVKGVKTLDVRVNSYGGDVFEGLSIYSLLRDFPAKVTVKIDGIAASIASVIAMAGEDVVMAESGSLMIHNAWGAAVGNADDMRAYADTLEKISGQLADVYVVRSGMSIADVRKYMDAETWFSAQEAKELSLVTNIAENVKASIPAFNADKYRSALATMSEEAFNAKFRGEQKAVTFPMFANVPSSLFERPNRDLAWAFMQRTKAARNHQDASAFITSRNPAKQR